MKLYTNCKRILENNNFQNGFVAGSTHFKDLWARDALYASWGALVIGLTEPVKNTLLTLQKNMKDGQVPLRVGRKSLTKVFLGIKNQRGAVYGDDKRNNNALDPNSLYLITVEKYLLATNDTSVRDTQKIIAAAEWLLAQDKNNDGLLEEEWYASWDDAIRKEGASIYNNALAYAALKAVARMTRITRYDKEAKRIKKSSAQLYNGTYYDAWTGTRVLDIPGNLLAIYCGLADTKEKERILKEIDRQRNTDVLLRTNYTKYSFAKTAWWYGLFGMNDYHNKGPYWSWIAALEALVREEKTREIHAALQEWNGTNTIYEILQGPKKPVKRLFYQSEKDFSWAAGLILAGKKCRAKK